jgi:hypothetical protein
MGTIMNLAENTGRREPGPGRARPPEPILASGGYVAARRQPEKRLMVAILESAVSDLQHYATSSQGRGRRFFFEAKAWFDSTASDGPGDFEYICQVLDFDPSFIRAGLRRWCAARRDRDALEPTAGPLPTARLLRDASRPCDTGRPGGQPGGEWWTRGFACMTPNDIQPSPTREDVRRGDGGQCESLP